MSSLNISIASLSLGLNSVTDQRLLEDVPSGTLSMKAVCTIINKYDKEVPVIISMVGCYLVGITGEIQKIRFNGDNKNWSSDHS